MKKFFFVLFILGFLINNCLFADNSKDANAEQCFDNMEIVENAVNTYIIKNKIKNDGLFFQSNSLVKENYLDSDKYLCCPKGNIRYAIRLKEGQAEVICLNHGTLALKKLMEENKRQKEKYDSMMNNSYPQKGGVYSYIDKYLSTNHHSFIDEHFLELFCFVFIPSIILIICLIYYFKKKSIEKYCEKNDFIYEESPAAMPGNSEAFDVLLTGDMSYFSNGMYKKIEDISINIVEFTTRKRRKRLSPSKIFTLCQLYKENVQFPVFFVRDKNVLLDSVGSMLGGQNIDFVEDKQFSDSFVLQGVNEEEVRRFFKSKVRNSFLKNHKRGNCYESKGRCFLLYRKGHVSINKKIEMMNTALKIFSDISSTGFKDNSLANDITRNPKYYVE